MVVDAILGICAILVLTVAFSFAIRGTRSFPRARRWASLLFPFSQIAVVGFLLYVLWAGSFPTWMFAAITAMSVLCTASDHFLFKGLLSAEERGLAEARARLLEEQVAAQEAYGFALLQEQREAQKVRNRIAAELREANELLEREENDAAVKRAEQAIARMDGAQHFCAHQVVDALLLSKARRCEEEAIRLDVQLSIPSTAFLPGADLCAVFSNALDNAIDACTKVAEGERFIDLKAHVKGGFLVVKVANSCQREAGGPIRADKGTRPFRGLSEHGWGLLIMESVAKRHDGSFDIQQHNGLCTTSVVMRVSLIT